MDYTIIGHHTVEHTTQTISIGKMMAVGAVTILLLVAYKLVRGARNERNN